jgi:hypothetical protein
MRAAAVEAFRYQSARDVDGGVNVGLFSPAAFAVSAPRRFDAWHCVADRDFVEMTRRDYLAETVVFAFSRD